MYKLKEEQRALAKKAADAADLERRRATVRSEAGTLRAKMAAELKAETDAENARLAAIEAAIQVPAPVSKLSAALEMKLVRPAADLRTDCAWQLEADEKARTERARSKVRRGASRRRSQPRVVRESTSQLTRCLGRQVAAEQAAAAKKREELEKLIAIAKFEARRYTIGQRVRVKTNGQVGTVANIKIEGAPTSPCAGTVVPASAQICISCRSRRTHCDHFSDIVSIGQVRPGWGKTTGLGCGSSWMLAGMYSLTLRPSRRSVSPNPL